MDCKKALVEADGDMDKAIEDLRKKSSLKAAKKAGRTAANGLLGVKSSEDGTRIAMVEVNIETDFAAKNEKFIAFVSKVAQTLFDSADMDAVAQSLNAERETLVQEIGENMAIRRGAVVESASGGLSYYMHGDQRRGAIVQLSDKQDELGRDLAMHVVAINPMVVKSDDVDADILDKEREIYMSQAQDSGKPEEIVVKMVEGRVKKFLSEVSLLDQPFVKDGNTKVGALVKQANTEVVQFVRYEVGEGIEVEEADFAAEVAAQLADSE
jgi:elongation factor Ts